MSNPWDHLVGLPYSYGTADCYGLVRRFYAEVMGINLPNYARPNDWWNKRPKISLVADNFRHAGFEPIQVPKHELRVGDLILIANQSPVACHIGIMVGSHRMLHHPPEVPSRIDLYAGWWADRVVGTIRHPDAPLVQGNESVSLLDLLPAHKRERYLAHVQRLDPAAVPASGE